MHGSPQCISRIWIEDTANFKQLNNNTRADKARNQSISESRNIAKRRLAGENYKNNPKSNYYNAFCNDDITDEIPFN